MVAIHTVKGSTAEAPELDGRKVPIITAFLFHAGGHEDPAPLSSNLDKSFQGSVIRGMGFTFDDSDQKEVASPIALMHDLIKKDKRNAERIFPFIGGEELNDNPTHSPSRYVINFGEMDEQEARRWPDLMRIVEERVKPARLGSKAASSKGKVTECWWRFGHTAKELYSSTKQLRQILVCAQTSKYRTVTFLPNGMVYDQKLVVFGFETYGPFSVLHSQVHEHWARFFGSSMKDDPVYTPSDCFWTFPFPENFETDAKLEAVGKEYYEFRAALMVKNNEGLTKTYNRFHDPNEPSAEIKNLRELHAALDRAVLAAYGWTDLQPTCEFLLDYDEEEEDEEDTGKARKKKKPWRYRWPDDFRDLVLARLLELNKQRAEQEALAGANAEEKPKKARRTKKKAESGGLYDNQKD